MFFLAVQVVLTYLTSLWFVLGCFIWVSVMVGQFYVVFGGFRFIEVGEEVNAPSAAVWRVSATTPQQHHHLDNPAKRF